MNEKTIPRIVSIVVATTVVSKFFLKTSWKGAFTLSAAVIAAELLSGFVASKLTPAQ